MNGSSARLKSTSLERRRRRSKNEGSGDFIFFDGIREWQENDDDRKEDVKAEVESPTCEMGEEHHHHHHHHHQR